MTDEEVRAIAELTAEFLGKPCPRFARWNRNRGWSNIQEGWFSLPRMDYDPEAYRIAYVVHEVVHCTHKKFDHGRGFKTIERKALAAWGIVPTYARAYAIRLETPEGELLWRQ